MEQHQRQGNHQLVKKPSKNLDFNSSFLLRNGFNHADADDQDSKNDPSSIKISDIEMITIQSVTYTSLKDILPSSPPSVISPTHNSSWHEIPIKNPLVKQAALAYLQPMSTPLETGDKGVFGRLKEMCCGRDDGSGCCSFVSWFRDVVFRSFRGMMMVDHDGDEDEDDDEDDEDDEHHEKVY